MRKKLALVALAGAVMLGFAPVPALAQFSVDIDIASPPSIHATGQAVVESPSKERLNQLLTDGWGQFDGFYDFEIRAYALAPCRNYDPQFPILRAIEELQNTYAPETGQERDHETESAMQSAFYTSVADVPPEYRQQYASSGAEPVQRVVKPVFTRITSQEYETEQADSDRCDNRAGTQPLTCTVTLTGTTTDTTTVTTTDQNAFNAAVDFSTKLRVGSSSSPYGGEFGFQAHFGYTKTQSTASAVTHTQTRTHAETETVTVAPGEGALIEMVIQQGTISGEVHYSATWQGDVVHHCRENGSMRMLDIASLYDGELERRWRGDGARAVDGPFYRNRIDDAKRHIGARQINESAHTDTFHIDAHTRVSTTNQPLP